MPTPDLRTINPMYSELHTVHYDMALVYNLLISFYSLVVFCVLLSFKRVYVFNFLSLGVFMISNASYN